MRKNMEKMRLGYFADGPWSHQALARIIADERFQITFIVARYPQPDSTLKGTAESLKIPFFVHENVNSSEFRDKIFGQSDLNISLSFNQILKRDLIDLAPNGFINCHAGGLPFYRGRNILNWAIINGEQRLGVTVHYVDEGIDTGDIISQDWITIHDSDDYGSVLEKAYVQCAKTLHQALAHVHSGTVKRVPQCTIHPTGFYCGGRIFGDEWINWELPSKRIFNFVRGINIPGPAARTMLGDREIAILETELCPGLINYIGTAGEVVGKNTDGVVVKTGDSALLVKRVADVDDKLLLNNRTPKFKIGTRFGYNIFVKINQLEERIKRIEQLDPSQD